MDEQPTVDVVTVWYNRGYRVKESIGSILTQDLRGYRVLAVDDGSTDNTREELEAMAPLAAERGVAYEVWSKENEGFTRSLKRAIEGRSTSAFIGLHGSGDISLPARLSTLLALLREHPSYAAAGCGVRVTGPDGETIGVRQKEGVARRDLPAGVIPKPCTHECAVIRRTAYDAIGGYREFFKYAQDSDLWLRLSRIGEIANTPEILFEKVFIPESVSANWKKGIQQKKYSTLAIQNGVRVDRGKPDLIEGLDRETWEKAVDPKLFMRRFHFPRRIKKAVFRGRLGEAAGLSWEFAKSGFRAAAKGLSGGE